MLGLVGLASLAFAQVAPVGVSIALTNEVVPAGSIAQVKVMLTEPKPIIRTGMKASFDESFFDEFLGLAAGGGLHGVGIVNGGKLRLELTNLTPDALQAGYPLVTIAVKTKPGLPLGYKVPVSLDMSFSNWIDTSGVAYTSEMKPGSVAIGGTQFIGNVIPGGGTIPAGATFKAIGGGFTKNESARVEGARLRSVSGTEMLFEVKAPLKLDGLRIVAQNGFKDQTTYYAYPRGIKTAPSTNPALNGVVPIFPITANLKAQAGLGGDPNTVLGVGLQNPTSTDTSVELHIVDVLGRNLSEAKVTVKAGEVLLRSFEELSGAPNPVGAFAITAEAKSTFQLVVAEFTPSTGAVQIRPVVSVVPAFY